MQLLLILLQILPLIPGIVRAAEAIHGAANGPKKLETAISLVTAIVPPVAQEIIRAPSNASRLTQVINAVVAAINAADTWVGTEHAVPVVELSPALPPA